MSKALPIDLQNAVVVEGSISLADAKIIAANRERAAAEMEGDFERVYRTESRVRVSCGNGSRLNLKGYGHRTIGAKTHGKVALPVRGSGYGNPKAERLHRR